MIFYIKIRSQVDISEVSLIVPDFTISVLAVHVYIILSYSFSFAFSFLRIGIPQAGWDANKQKEKEKKRESDKKRENYINYCSVHRKGTIGLALDQKNNYLLNLYVYILCLPLFSQHLPYTTFQRFKQYFRWATYSSSTKCNAV